MGPYVSYVIGSFYAGLLCDGSFSDGTLCRGTINSICDVINVHVF
jgi:hypothetical protein